jgi:integrase
LVQTLNKLTDKAVKALTKPGRHSDGGNLFLTISKSGSKAWVFIFRFHGRSREAGLGPLAKMTLAMAREKADEGRKLLGAGKDPIEQWRQEKRAKEVPTFAEAAKQYFEAHKSEWRSDKHGAEWRRTIEVYCKPIASLPVNVITADDVVAVLKPWWAKKPEAMSRLRGRIEKVLGWAKASGHIPRDQINAALWKNELEHRLAKKPAPRHFRALPYEEAPAFVAELRSRRRLPGGGVNVPVFALEWLILTGCRTNEVLGARWDEVDLDGKLGPIWTVPAARTKRDRPHAVPITTGALAILDAMREIKAGVVIFPGRHANWPLSGMTFIDYLRRLHIVNTTAHGFRSTLRDYLGNETSTPHDVAEEILAHAVGDPTVRSYRRGDAIKKRRRALQLWDAYLASPAVATVIPIGSKKRA